MKTAQKNNDLIRDQYKIWTFVDSTLIDEIEPNKRKPKKYQVLKMNMVKAKAKLKPLEPSQNDASTISFENSKVTVVSFELPSANKQFLKFEMKNSKLFSDQMAKKFPNIRSYSGNLAQNPAVKVRLDMNPKGLFAMITQPDETIYIRPFDEEGKYYICFYKSDINRDDIDFYEPTK